MRGVGLAVAVVGLATAAALLVYVASGWGRRPAGVLAFLRVALWAAVVSGVGAWMEVAVISDREAAGWVAVATDGRAAGGLIRLVAAGLVVIGLFEEPVLAGGDDPGRSARWVPAGSGAIAAAGVLIGAVALVVG